MTEQLQKDFDTAIRKIFDEVPLPFLSITINMFLTSVKNIIPEYAEKASAHNQRMIEEMIRRMEEIVGGFDDD
jgi:hypothetical protein